MNLAYRNHRFENGESSKDCFIRLFFMSKTTKTRLIINLLNITLFIAILPNKISNSLSTYILQNIKNRYIIVYKLCMLDLSIYNLPRLTKQRSSLLTIMI